ncbi:hypothetical protein TRVA0_041S01222 [Trichomonascus vanleenenianus]|uniref:Ilm1p n=1 Tax=Trichomonascus vanleenenianus TaxID=2268995 RepID=UPI003ECB4D73
MELPLANLRYDNPLIGLVALLLILLGVADLPPLAGDYILYFENALLYRLFAYFGIAGYSYFVYSPLLSNSLVFCFSFLELVLNFVIYATLREERNDINGEQLRFIVEEEEEEETLEEL